MSNLNSCQVSLSKHMHQLLANQLSLDVCVLCVCVGGGGGEICPNVGPTKP